MKALLIFLLVAGYAQAQTDRKIVRGDSVPGALAPESMPNARPGNSFYNHRPAGPGRMMRATTDNMPVLLPDSSVVYTMRQVYPPNRRLREPPTRFNLPSPPAMPRKRW